MSDFQVTVLGVGDSFSETHHSTALLLECDGFRLAIDCPERLEVTSYAGAWSQVLSNLINNSVTHAFPAGWQDPRIRIEVRIEGDDLVAVYSDNGQGMSEQVARRVFEPFFTTNRQGGGSGLGMHIVYNLVHQQLHGRVALQTEPGQGCRFTLRLPLHLSAAPAGRAAPKIVFE